MTTKTTKSGAGDQGNVQACVDAVRSAYKPKMSAPIEQIERDTELRNCPFHPPKEAYEISMSYSQNNEGLRRHMVECSTCGAMGPYCLTEKEAAELWNCRQACGQQLTEETEKLGLYEWQRPPAGYKLVPIEPTKEMRNACLAVIAESLGTGEETRCWYKAMLAAAPTPPVQQPCDHVIVEERESEGCIKCGAFAWPKDDEQPTTTGWRDISSAPRDGTVIDLFGTRNDVAQRFANAQWIQTVWGGERLDQFCWAHNGWDGYGRFEYTHWKPLPAAPHPVRGGEQ